MRLGLGIGIDRQRRGGTPAPAGAIARWDFSDVNSLSFSTGENISGATDLAGNGHNAAQGTTDLQPLRVPNVVNGRAVARFNDDRLDVAHDDVFQANSLMVFAVARFDDASLDTRYVIARALSWALLSRDENRLRAVAWTTSSSSVTAEGNPNPMADDGYHIIGLTANPPSTAQLWVDGESIASVAFSTAHENNTEVRIGALAASPGSGLIGDIGEILIYPYDVDKIAAINAYLSARWGITL